MNRAINLEVKNFLHLLLYLQFHNLSVLHLCNGENGPILMGVDATYMSAMTSLLCCITSHLSFEFCMPFVTFTSVS